MEDYLRVRVETAIAPATPLVHVGASISFELLLDDVPETGFWSSLQPEVFVFTEG